MSLLEEISQPWAMQERKLSALAELAQLHADAVKKSPAEIQKVVDDRDAARMASRPWDSILSNRSKEEQKAGFYMQGPVAVVPIEGVLAHRAGLVNGASAPRGMSDTEIQRVVRAAGEVAQAMVLHFDSPGGTVQGIHATAEVISEVGKKIPIVSFVNDMADSKAYWYACMAAYIMAAPAAKVGSIGSMAVIADTSRVAESQGVKLHVIKSGEMKGAGWPGTPITEKMLANWQHEIDQHGAMFSAVVGERRQLAGDRLAQVTDGRDHLPPDAQAFGLIDGTGNIEAAIAKAASLIKNTPADTRGHTRKAAMNLNELKTAQGPLLAEFRTEVVNEIAAGEKERTAAAVAAAVDKAIKDEREKKPVAATRAELKAIVPEGMAGREDLIGALQDRNATAIEAQQAVVAKLAENNARLAADLAEAQKTSLALGDKGKGVAPLKFTPGVTGNAGDFEKIVLGIVNAEKCDMQTAIAKASINADNTDAREDWVSRGCPAIKAA